MQKPAFDPGLTREFGAPLRRAINKDGSYNVLRSGVNWRAFHPWVFVIQMRWRAFAALVIGFYLIVNTIFAFAYFEMDPSEITGTASPTEAGRFLNDFFFSAHTLTTVGYGSLSPHGVEGNVFAIAEALTGLLGFAVVTGMLVTRASKPSASIAYSENALVAPYQNGSAVMFRIANRRSNNLLELEAQVMLMTVGGPPTRPERKFEILNLERKGILIFALTWTVVHPIDESSPFFGKTPEDLARMQAEVLILLKGFDESFGQVVHSRYSYRYDEFVWGAKFQPAFSVDPTGDLRLELDLLGDYSATESVPTARMSRDDDPTLTSNKA